MANKGERALPIVKDSQQLRRSSEELKKRIDAAQRRAEQAIQRVPAGEFHEQGAAFLRTELRTALMFVGIAEKTVRQEKRERNLSKARQAYGALVHFRPSIKLTSADAAEIDEGITNLKSALQQLGEGI